MGKTEHQVYRLTDRPTDRIDCWVGWAARSHTHKWRLLERSKTPRWWTPRWWTPTCQRGILAWQGMGGLAWMIFDMFSCDLYRRCLQRMSLRQARVGTVYASHLIPFSYW